LKTHQPLPRNTVSVLNRRGKVVLNDSKLNDSQRFIFDFGNEKQFFKDAGLSADSLEGRAVR
jgi:hypothetical protein